jgi:hypothetical protein
MKRTSFALAALAGLLALVLPGAASAQIVELGTTSTAISAPSCPPRIAPANCNIILTRTTAMQSISDGVANPTRVKSAGWIVAFTVGLSDLSSSAKTELSFLHVLDSSYGGTPQVALTVLKPGKNNTYKVAARSGTFHVLPFLGQVLQEPLSLPSTFSTFTALPVLPGEVIGLTVPTWAPVLSYNLSPTRFSYRQSRSANCGHVAATNTAQVAVGQTARYLCTYTGTRVEYSATEIVNTPYPKKYVHTTRRP